jgi:hypothetical protein
MDTYGFGEHKDKAMRTDGPMTINRPHAVDHRRVPAAGRGECAGTRIQRAAGVFRPALFRRDGLKTIHPKISSGTAAATATTRLACSTGFGRT